MALHLTPEDHAADPPAAWQVVRIAPGSWHLDSSLGGTFGYFTTRREALAERESGRLVDLYEREGRWFAGQTPAGMRSYADCAAERRRTHDRFHQAQPFKGCPHCKPANAAVAAGGNNR